MLDGDKLVRSVLGNKMVDLKDAVQDEVAQKVVNRINDKKNEIIGAVVDDGTGKQDGE